MAQEHAHAGDLAPRPDPAPAEALASLEEYDRRLASDPGNGELHMEKLSLLCGLGRHEEALGACDAAIALCPGEARLFARKIHTLYRLGRHGEALEAIERAMQDAPAVPAPGGAETATPVPLATTGGKRPRLRGRDGTALELAGFVGYLVDRNIIKDAGSVNTFEGRHRLHKYAYIAKALGMRVGYEFDFLKSGAFSSDLAVDTKIKTAACDAVPFSPEERASKAFVGLVRNRGREWLQVATFAMRALGADGGHDAFVKARHERMDYDAGLIDEVFGMVGSAVASLGRNG